jgi:hypothetical protein
LNPSSKIYLKSFFDLFNCLSNFEKIYFDF